MTPRLPHWVVCLAVALTACGTQAPRPEPPAVPPQWQAPLPHGGDAHALRDWWARFDDPALAELVDAAQRSNPTLEQARARVLEARAGLAQARSLAWPSLDGRAGVTRGRSEVPPPALTSTTLQAGLDTAWEIDLFGSVRHGLAAAQARADAAGLAWHDARVSLAAETAQAYVGLRACESVLAFLTQEAQSQARSAELTRAKVQAGFDAPAVGALADASAADTANRRAAQRVDCEVTVKALVQLTGLDEPALRMRLQDAAARLPQPAAVAMPAVPAAALSQRPDLAAAERELAAAAADVGFADAQRYPRLSLSGSIGFVRLRSAGFETDGPSWSFGPLLSVPLFDGGRRAAQVDAARARFTAARAAYEARARQAVREVEEALVRLDAAAGREADAQRAAQGFRAHFAATEDRWRVGAGSVIEMEDARRLWLAAQAGLVAVQRERVAAWIALYRAVGGGWTTEDTGP